MEETLTTAPPPFSWDGDIGKLSCMSDKEMLEATLNPKSLTLNWEIKLHDGQGHARGDTQT
jgi:hypothetical protein